MHALLGAYTPEGRAWVDELCAVLTENVDYACRYIAEHFPGVRVAKPEGTYLLFLDCTDWCAAHGKDHRRGGTGRLGRRRGLAGRPYVPRPLRYPCESGPAEIAGG